MSLIISAEQRKSIKKGLPSLTSVSRSHTLTCLDGVQILIEWLLGVPIKGLGRLTVPVVHQISRDQSAEGK